VGASSGEIFAPTWMRERHMLGMYGGGDGGYEGGGVRRAAAAAVCVCVCVTCVCVCVVCVCVCVLCVCVCVCVCTEVMMRERHSSQNTCTQ
jgi:hypothetical protein